MLKASGGFLRGVRDVNKRLIFGVKDPADLEAL